MKSWGCGPYDEISAYMRRNTKELAAFSLSLPTSMWEHSEKVTICKPGKGTESTDT